LNAARPYQKVTFRAILKKGLKLSKIDLTSTLWMSVSSKSRTKQYSLSLCMGPRNGGNAFGKFWKLLGKVAFETLAIALALRIANGFFPVKLV